MLLGRAIGRAAGWGHWMGPLDGASHCWEMFRSGSGSMRQSQILALAAADQDLADDQPNECKNNAKGGVNGIDRHGVGLARKGTLGNSGPVPGQTRSLMRDKFLNRRSRCWLQRPIQTTRHRDHRQWWPKNIKKSLCPDPVCPSRKLCQHRVARRTKLSAASEVLIE